MPFRRLAALLILSVLLLCACAPKVDTIQTGAALENTQPTTTETAAPVIKKQAPQRIGFIVHDDGSEQSALLMHGFLQMSENTGYPARLYRAQAGQEAQAALENAIADGCEGLLIQNTNGANDAAVEKALQAGIKVVVPYDSCKLSDLHANVVVDESEYVEEIVRSIATRMMERSLKSGRILVYHQDPADTAASAFHDAVAQYYSQYQSLAFVRTAADEAGAVAELSDFLLYNRDIKGMFVTDPALAVIAVKARNDAAARFKKDGAPSPTPTIAPQDETVGETPAPTVAPGLLTQISITIFACGQSEENYALLQSNDIYGLCIEPYYDASAQGVMMLDQLLSGDLVPPASRVNRPIVTANTLEKYSLIYRHTQELFGMQAQ